MPAHAGLRVERRALVRVLAVGEVLDLLEREDDAFRERLAVGEPRRDRGLVRGGVRERLGGELAASRRRQLALVAELLEDRAVPLRRADRGDVDEVLGGGAQHRRPADVDHLDGVLLADVLLARDGGERVEVDADEVERLDAVLLERGEIVLRVAPGEDGRVDARVQRLDAPAEELGNVGQLVDRRDREAELGDVRGAPAARHEVDSRGRRARVRTRRDRSCRRPR